MIQVHKSYRIGKFIQFYSGEFFHELQVFMIVFFVRKSGTEYTSIHPRFKIWRDPFWR